jgi:hypothetical protein
MYVFSSANAIRQYDINQLVELGIEWIWLGLEGESAAYSKLKGTDTLALVRRLQAHGICVLGSTIIGMEDHTPENIDRHIAYAVAHDAAFHQFMLYTPMPGTPLYREMSESGRMDANADLPDIHGQFGFNFHHAAISRTQSKTFLDRAFAADFAANGPSLYRLTRVMFDRWKQYRQHADSRVRARLASGTRIRRSAAASGNCGSRWSASWAASRPPSTARSARSCCGARAARRAATPPAARWSRGRLSTGAPILERRAARHTSRSTTPNHSRRPVG